MLSPSKCEYTSVSSSACDLSHPYRTCPGKRKEAVKAGTNNLTWPPTEHGRLHDGICLIEKASRPFFLCIYTNVGNSLIIEKSSTEKPDYIAALYYQDCQEPWPIRSVTLVLGLKGLKSLSVPHATLSSQHLQLPENGSLEHSSKAEAKCAYHYRYFVVFAALGGRRKVRLCGAMEGCGGLRRLSLWMGLGYENDPKEAMKPKTLMIYNLDIDLICASDAVTEASTYIAHFQPKHGKTPPRGPNRAI